VSSKRAESAQRLCSKATGDRRYIGIRTWRVAVVNLDITLYLLQLVHGDFSKFSLGHGKENDLMSPANIRARIRST
jgi:hypothetical protein